MCKKKLRHYDVAFSFEGFKKAFNKKTDLSKDVIDLFDEYINALKKNYYYFFQICSISSNVLPLVSGTNLQTKNAANKPINPYTQ